MSFHADFWVVVGTAAPVIALSTILVSGDQLQLDIEIEISTGKAPGDIPFRQWSDLQYSSFFWGMVTGIIILAQAGTFAVSLLSLTRESNVLSPTLVTVAEFFSLGVLAVSTTQLIRLKDLAKQIEQDKHSLSRRSKILRHPSRRAQVNTSRRANRYRVAHQIANARSARRGPQPRK